jgi:hypothetical protein
MAKRNDPLYQPHPSKAAQIAEREAYAARLREIEERAKAAGVTHNELSAMSTREREAAIAGLEAAMAEPTEPAPAPKSTSKTPAK